MIWKYRKLDWLRSSAPYRYEAIRGRDTCDGFEVYEAGRMFVTKADVERFVRLANHPTPRKEG